MSRTLAMHGGAPIRTRPFTTWPIFGEAEEQRLLQALRSGRWGRLQGPEVESSSGGSRPCTAARHGIAVVNGTVSLRIALHRRGPPCRRRGHRPRLHLPLDGVGRGRGQLRAGVRRHRPADTSTSTRVRSRPPSLHGHGPSSRSTLPASRPTWTPSWRSHADTTCSCSKTRRMPTAPHIAGRSAGSIGHAASFSFQSSKNLTAGEGGIITTNDEALAAACRSIHNCGRVPEGVWYEHHVISGNYRLGEFQGAVLNCQLDRLEAQTATRDANGRYLASRLAVLPGVSSAGATRRLHAAQSASLHAAARRRGLRRPTRGGAAGTAGGRHSVQRRLRVSRCMTSRCSGTGRSAPTSLRRVDALDYTGVRCPNSERICREQGVWLDQATVAGRACRHGRHRRRVREGVRAAGDAGDQ